MRMVAVFRLHVAQAGTLFSPFSLRLALSSCRITVRWKTSGKISAHLRTIFWRGLDAFPEKLAVPDLQGPS